MKLSVQETTLARVQGTLRDTEEEVCSLKEVVAQQEDELHAREMERRQLHNTIQELKASYINTCCSADAGDRVVHPYFYLNYIDWLI